MSLVILCDPDIRAGGDFASNEKAASGDSNTKNRNNGVGGNVGQPNFTKGSLAAGVARLDSTELPRCAAANRLTRTKKG
jgi:hypothetical protein